MSERNPSKSKSRKVKIDREKLSYKIIVNGNNKNKPPDNGTDLLANN